MIGWIGAIAACGARSSGEPAPAALRGSPFVCSTDVCTQAFPAYPDDGEWECIDLEGIVACRGGVPAAGVRAGAADASFVCGPLAGDADHRRVCVDAAPDVPSAPAAAWRCGFRREGATEARWCARDEHGTRLGSPCEGECPAGMRCVAGACALARTSSPECWLDADCGGGHRCVLAHCEAS